MALGNLGCIGVVETSEGETINPVPTHAPEFPAQSGQAAKPVIAYPAGPYGINVGSIAPNLEWIGFQNASIKNDGMQTIRLSDFYNPHANDPAYAPVDAAHDDRLYNVELYGMVTPKPVALSVNIGSVWCPPCNAEAKTDLPPLHAKYKPMGGEFLLALGDSLTQGKPATPKDLFNWTKKYKVDFPATIDPDYTLGEFFAYNAWPANMIIDTRTMKIIKIVAGVPDAAYWERFEVVINAK